MNSDSLWRSMFATLSCMAQDQEPPPKVAPRLKSAPKVRQLYWCDFPQDAHLPEFWKRRPVIVVPYKNTLHGAVTVIPCSTQAQPDNPWAISLQTTIDGRAAFAICDKPCTVAVSPLLPHKAGIIRMPEEEFEKVLALLLKWLPRLPPSPAQGEASRRGGNA